MAWKKGESGNPAGRVKNSTRQELGDAFVRVLKADWEANGAQTVITMREKDPVAYVKVVAALMPQQVEMEVSQGLAALLSGSDRADEASPREAGPVEETGTDAVRH